MTPAYSAGMETIGSMVATLARAQGVTTSALAEAVNIHRNRLADKIAGRREFTEGDIRKIASYFGVTPGHLFLDPLDLLGVTTTGSTSIRWYYRTPASKAA